MSVTAIQHVAAVASQNRNGQEPLQVSDGASAPPQISVTTLRACSKLVNTSERDRFYQAQWDATCCWKCGSSIDAGQRVTMLTKVFNGMCGTLRQDAACCDDCVGDLSRPPPEHDCENCGRPIRRWYGGGRSRTWCSERCSQQFYNRRRPRTSSCPKVCASCNEDFVAPRRDAKFCSPACKQKAYRARRASS